MFINYDILNRNKLTNKRGKLAYRRYRSRNPDWLAKIPYDDSCVHSYSNHRRVEDFWSSRSTSTTDASNFKKMNMLDRGGIVQASLFAVISAIFCGLSYASEELQAGKQYKIIRPVYLTTRYDSLNNRQLSRATARAYLNPIRYYKKAEVAFQTEVPAGTIMTIIGSAPKVLPLPFFANQYFVQLDPDPSRGLDVELSLDRGMEGSLDGLNLALFGRP
jgi:hypothetical protein